MEIPSDARDTIPLDLRSYGGPHLRIEPRLGYIACRVYDAESDRLLYCCALKTALRRVADSLPRTLGARNML